MGVEHFVDKGMFHHTTFRFHRIRLIRSSGTCRSGVAHMKAHLVVFTDCVGATTTRASFDKRSAYHNLRLSFSLVHFARICYYRVKRASR